MIHSRKQCSVCLLTIASLLLILGLSLSLSLSLNLVRYIKCLA